MRKVVIVLSIFLCFCDRQEKSNVNVIDLLHPIADKITLVSEIATDINYIPLQTTDSSQIGRIHSLKAAGNYLYINTFDHLFCFDKSGNFLFKLNKIGRGPGEYLFIQDFDINFNNTILAILYRSKVFLYKQTKGGFIYFKSLSFPNPPSKINFTDNSNSLLLQYSNQDGKITFSDELVNIEGYSLITWPNYMGYTLKDGTTTFSSYENISFWSQNRLFVKKLQNDTLFCLTEMNALEPFLIFCTRDKRLTPEARSNGKYYADHMNDYFHVTKILGSKRYIYFTYYFNNISKKIVYDQISRLTYNVPEKSNLIDDLAGGISFEPQYCNNGFFYTWVDAISLKEYIGTDQFKKANVKYPEKKMSKIKLADSLTDFDNPILIVAKIK